MNRLIFGSASIRVSWARSTSGCCSVPCRARAKSSSSGIELQRKYESRDASSQSLTVSRRCEVEPSSRWKKLFDVSTATIAARKAERKFSPAVNSPWMIFRARSSSASVTGRRHARIANRRRHSRASVRSPSLAGISPSRFFWSAAGKIGPSVSTQSTISRGKISCPSSLNSR